MLLLHIRNDIKHLMAKEVPELANSTKHVIMLHDVHV